MIALLMTLRILFLLFCLESTHQGRCRQGACHECGCVECPVSLNACTKCKDGFYLDNGKCSTCPSGCSTCDSSSNCSSCKSAYYIVGSQCQWNFLFTIILVISILGGVFVIILLACITYRCCQSICKRSVSPEQVLPQRHPLPHPIQLRSLSQAHLAESLNSWQPYQGPSRSDDICPICLQKNDGKVVLACCGHGYHAPCIGAWSMRQNNCPQCREDLQTTFRLVCLDCGAKAKRVKLWQVQRMVVVLCDECSQLQQKIK